MADEPSAPNPFFEVFETIFKFTWEVIVALVSVIPRILSFILWCLAGVIVLPCVFVAGTIYPKWTEWGENF